jgi:hypothetical protein
MRNGGIIQQQTANDPYQVTTYPSDFCHPMIVHIWPLQRPTKRAVLYAPFPVIQDRTALEQTVTRGLLSSMETWNVE